MVNPGAFSGSRRVFLEDQKEIYAAAVSANHVADTVTDIQRRYFKRYPIYLQHDVEPTSEALALVDDDAPDPELVPPDADSLSPEDYAQQTLEYNTLIRDIKQRKDQIKRRLQYQYNKDRDEQSSVEKGSSDPIAILMAKLTGEDVRKPRKRTAFNIWGPENRFFVDPVFKQRVENNNVPAKQQAALRSSIYKEMFEELGQDEQREWFQRAEDEHQAALEEFNAKFKAAPSTTPEARQRVIQALPKFIEPILDLVADHTGWKVSLIAGGPEPADGGRLNMVSIHSGVTCGSVKMDFGRSERTAYRNYVIPTFGSFLKKCYSIEECRSRALSSDHAATKLAMLGAEEVDVHHFDIDPVHVSVAQNRPQALSSQTSVTRASGDRSSASTSASNIGSRGITAALTIAVGAPKGRKKGALRPLPSRDAATVLMPPLPEQIIPRSAAAMGNPSPTPLATACPSSSPTFATTGHADSLSRALTPPRAPTPAHSRAPTPVPSRAPTPAPSRAPTPAPAADTSLVPAPTPTPTTASQAPIPPAKAARAPALVPSRAPTTAAFLVDILEPANIPSTPVQPPPTSTSDHISSASPAPAVSGIPPAPICAPPSVQPTPSMTVCTPPLLSTNPVQSAPPCLQVLGICKPSGAATVPDPSFFANSKPAAKSRKKKGLSGHVSSGDVGHGPKTRSSAPVAVGKRKAPGDESVSTQKRQKQIDGTSKGTGAFNVAIPTGCPAWVINALNLVTAVDLSTEWRSLVASWLKFEEGRGFKQDGPKLGNQRRPRVVSDWIQRARTFKYRPEIEDLSAFGADFRFWWKSLQPDWRIVEGTDEMKRDGGDWEALACGGQNGMLSVVACLFFWGMAAADGEGTKKTWAEDVDDVAYVLTQLS